jgi:hypothetical protein
MSNKIPKLVSMKLFTLVAGLCYEQMFRGLVRIYGYLQQFAFSYVVSVGFVNNNFILQSGAVLYH